MLGNAYAADDCKQAAEIIIDAGAGDTTVPWEPGMIGAPQLGQVAVFDSASAQLYVDNGKQIRYLPFGLALLHRLNAICLLFKSTLEAEQRSAIGNKIDLTAIAFSKRRDTVAQKFNRAISQTTDDKTIRAASAFFDEDSTRLAEITSILSSGLNSEADLASLISWANGIALECATVATALSDDAFATMTMLRSTASIARESAKLAASALFDDEPLNGVSSDSWRALWRAARNYSMLEAYPEQRFPVLQVNAGIAACVLCQQPLLPNGATRMQRFQAYMDDTLDTAATDAEHMIDKAIAALPALTYFRAHDFAEHLNQVRSRDSVLYDALAAFRSSAMSRLAEAATCLLGKSSVKLPELFIPTEMVIAFAKKLADERTELSKANDANERRKFETEKAELEDRKILSLNVDKLITRRDLMLTNAAYEKAMGLVATTGITKRANELVDTHLTSAVVSQFDLERESLDIMHLKIGIARKSGQTRAEFEIDPQTALTRVTSQILSEGEQRALALASFLTEVTLTEGSGPVVIDDPVSSLDRDRSVLAAKRIIAEASKRQVIVFTHDMVFLNELCQAADAVGIDPVTVALFSDHEASGKIDPAGIPWKGLNVVKRIKQIKQRFEPLPKLYSRSPADYEYEIKNIYGRLRDTYERVVEEVIFCDIVKRGSDVIQTQMLRYVTLPHSLAIRFHEGMSRANTHSHDNPASDTVPVPKPDEFLNHVDDLEQLIADFKIAKEQAEIGRPEMKPKK